MGGVTAPIDVESRYFADTMRKLIEEFGAVFF